MSIGDAPFKIGWQGEKLWLEVMPTSAQTDAMMAGRTIPSTNAPQIQKNIAAYLSDDTEIDWGIVHQVISRYDGIPTIIGGKKQQNSAQQPKSGCPPGIRRHSRGKCLSNQVDAP